MKTALAVLLVLHGAVHVLGFVKAFGFAELERLRRPIARSTGVLWLVAALGLVAAAALLFVAPRSFWVAALPALVLSQALVVSAWRDAKLGTIPNAVLAVPLSLALLDLRPSSLRSRYADEVRRAAEHVTATAPVTEADLAPLPPLVQTYLRRVGVVGEPHVSSFRATFRAQLRSAPDAPWMDAVVEQHNFLDPPSRLFFMEASRGGVPVVAFHRYVGDHASFEVRIAGLYPIIDARGPEMDQSETVTMFNDLCLLAPAALVDARVGWEPLDAHRVRATFINAGHTIRADLIFDAEGDLVDFVSNDRYASDGKTSHRYPWSTPVSSYAVTSGHRLWKVAEARWHEPSGTWTYIRFVLESIEYGVGAPGRERAREGGAVAAGEAP